MVLYAWGHSMKPMPTTALNNRHIEIPSNTILGQFIFLPPSSFVVPHLNCILTILIFTSPSQKRIISL